MVMGLKQGLVIFTSQFANWRYKTDLESWLKVNHVYIWYETRCESSLKRVSFLKSRFFLIDLWLVDIVQNVPVFHDIV